MIKSLKNGKFQLWTKDGKRPLGKVTTREQALAQERAIKARQAGGTKKRCGPMQ